VEQARDLAIHNKVGAAEGLALIRGMRRSLTDDEQERVAEAIVNHFELSNRRIEEGPVLESASYRKSM
jgi:hypothetical protein